MQFKAEVDYCKGVVIVRLVGRLQCEHVSEFTRLCDASPMPVRLDLADLLSADDAGLDALLTLQIRGARVAGASQYVALQLERVRDQRALNLEVPEPPGT